MKKTLLVTLVLAMMLTMIPMVGLAEASADAPTIEIYISRPWVSSPLPPAGEDLYQNWVNETYGGNFTLTYSSEAETELLARFAANNPPDLLNLTNEELNMLYGQGMLMADWTPYLEQMPQTVANMGELQQKYFTRDGNLICIPSLPGDQAYSFLIRKDWLETLNLEAPTNREELLDVLKAFTFNDPDGNGEDDTYGITSAGGGKNVGELSNLLLMFSSIDFYIDDAGEVTHPILNGEYQAYLDFLKEIVDAKVIDPDWYTQGWDERKPALYQGKYGVTWYPPAALIEEMVATRNDDIAVDWWEVMGVFDGALAPMPLIGSIRTVSAAAGEDAAKMEKIVAFLEGCAVPNDAYYIMRHGVEIDNREMAEFNGMKYIYNDPDAYLQKSGNEGAYLATAVWGQIINTYSDNAYFGNTPEPSRATMASMDLTAKVLESDFYAADYRLLNPDPTTVEEANAVRDEFTINYVLGKDTNYDAFVETWKNSGGSELLEHAVATFTEYELIP